MNKSKKILLLGASGSIGKQCIDIVEEANGDFILTAFSVGKNIDFARELLLKYDTITHAYCIDKESAQALKSEFPKVVFYSGASGLSRLSKDADYDMCIDALVGFIGLEPAVVSLKRNKILCLANKEALVTGGTVINKLLKKGYGKLYPIDSEHVALAKCLSKCKRKNVKKLIITASGGALRDMPLEKLEFATPEDALKHPTWKMGNKITIDCATMMNKGFEIIEAYYLFGYPLDKIEILMHDESLVHSLVELDDGTYIADYGKPDMHNPIKWAMYEGKIDYDVIKIKSLDELGDCHFHEYDPRRYPCTELAKKALREGASKMVALNAANEVMVHKFLNGKIRYLDIAKNVEIAMNNAKAIANPPLIMIKLLDLGVRKAAE